MTPSRRLQHLAILASALAAATPAPALAASNCLWKVLQSLVTLENPRKGVLYRVQLKGDPTIRELFYSGEGGDPGKPYVEFTERRFGGPTHRFSKGDIQDQRPWTGQGRVSDAVQEWGIGMPVDAHKLGQAMFRPYRKLASRPGVEVVGSWIGSETAEALLSNLLQFDERMTALGFAKPEKTRVILNDSPLLPSMKGPHMRTYPVFNVWSQDRRNMIAMEPLGWDTRTARRGSILRHERMHALLQRTYAEDAWVNQDLALQEALADFGAALSGGQPVIGENTIGDNWPIRDISRRWTATSKPLDSLLDVTATDYHYNSLLMSNVLWRIREVIGVEATDAFFKRFVDGLNEYRGSFDSLEKQAGVRPGIDRRQRFIHDFEYFLSVARKEGSAGGLGGVTEVTDEVMRELGLSAARVDRIASGLRRSDRSFAYDGKGEVTQGIITAAKGTAAVVIEGYVIYKKLIEEDDRGD